MSNYPSPFSSVPPSYVAKPGQLQSVAIMCMIDGVLNILYGISLAIGLLFATIICFPLGIYPVILGILEINYATKLMAEPARVNTPAQYLAIMQICNVLFGDVVSLIIGIISLVFYSDPQVRNYFGALGSMGNYSAPPLPPPAAPLPVQPPADQPPGLARQAPTLALDGDLWGQLVVLGGAQQGMIFALRQPVATVGRAPHCDVVLSDPAVSGQHARLEIRDQQVFIQDLNSANGTLVNQQRVTQPTRLYGGETILFVNTAVRFERIGAR